MGLDTEVPVPYYVSVAEDTPTHSLRVAPLVSEGELRVPRPNLFGRAGPDALRNRNYYGCAS